jgi:tRNA G18 (ribose-2'-O)-methylase SpoU
MNIEITSRANPRLKELLVAKEKLFFFEGEKLVRDVLARKLTVQKLLVSAEGDECLAGIAATVEERWQVSRQVLEKVSDLKDPPPLVAVLAVPEGKIDFLLQPLTLGFIGIQDPANLGTVFRCASAFGVSALALAGGCVRPNHPKVIRSAQTAILDVPFQIFPGADELIDKALAQNARVYVTGSRQAAAALPLAQMEFPCLLLFGNEGRGLEPRLLERFPLIRLEQKERIDSLNVAVSACILMHDLQRLRGV